THVLRINSLRFEILNRGGAEQVASHFCHHAHVCTAQACRNGLIGPFAAKTKIEFLAENRLSRPRKHVIERREIHVGAADYGNEGLLGHHFASDDSARGLYRNSVRKLQQLSPASPIVSLRIRSFILDTWSCRDYKQPV